MRRAFLRALLLSLMLGLVLATAGVASAGPLEQAAGTHPTHALVIELDAVGTAVLADYQRTAQATPLVSFDSTRAASEMANPSNLTDPVNVLLLDDASGAVVFQTVAYAAHSVRGEFAHDPANPSALGFDGSAITGVVAPLARTAFTVRLPVIAGATRVSIQPMRGTRSVTMIDLAAAEANFAGLRDARTPTLYPIGGFPLSSRVENRVDVLIMGDGYTDAQLSKFRSDAKAFADGMFAIAPYSTYRSFFNVRAVFAPSTQDGADRPPYNPSCNDFDMSDGASCCRDNNPSWTSQYRNTRYDSTFCYAQIARLLVARNTAQIYADANAAYPDWDEIWLIVNDTTYGGSGGEIAAASINPYGVQIQQHEVGHSLLGLADEYGGVGGGTCNDRNIDTNDDCRPNVTNVTTRANLKWNYWVSSSTPIPTSGPLSSAGAAGLWQGAFYSDTAYYRGCFNCIMRVLGAPFGAVAAEQLPLVLYRGGWEGTGTYYSGNPSGTGVRLIDYALPINATVDIAAGSSQSFGAEVVGPTGKKIQVQWILDGNVVKSERVTPYSVVSYVLTPLEALSGSTLTLQVSDVHPILHPQNRIFSRATVTWTINADGAPNAASELLVNGGFESNGSADNRAENWTHTNLRGGRNCVAPAHEGTCSYLMRGLGTKAGSLVQLRPDDVGSYADAGDLLVFSGRFVTSKLSGKFDARAILTWSDSTVTPIILDALPANSAGSFTLREKWHFIDLPETRTVESIRILFRFRKGALGTVRADSISLLNYPDFLQ